MHVLIVDKPKILLQGLSKTVMGAYFEQSYR